MENIQQLARDGNPQAIAALIGQALKVKGITVTAALSGSCLRLKIEAAQLPNQKVVVDFVQNGLTKLKPGGIDRVKLYGHQAGEPLPVWEDEFKLGLSIPQHQEAVKSEPQKSSSVKTLVASKPGMSKQTRNGIIALVGCLSVFVVIPALGSLSDSIDTGSSKKQEVEQAETRRKAEARQAKETSDRQRAGASLVKFKAQMKTIDPSNALIANVENNDRITGQVTITVSNYWHNQNYQLRLQAAQNLWKTWAALYSPTEPDSARIELVDFNGNKVGGSSMWGGSMVEVDK